MLGLVGLMLLYKCQEKEPAPVHVTDASPQLVEPPDAEPERDPLPADPPPTDPPPAAPSPKMSKREAVDMWNAVRDLLDRAHAMDEARLNGDTARCMDLMDELLPQAQALDRKSSRIPVEFVELGVAANHLTRCVTCNHENARFNCRETAAALKRVKARNEAK